MIDASASRAAVMTWRDDASLAAMALVHEAGTAAMRVMEAQLDTIPLSDVMTGAEAAARAVVRPAMRDGLAEAAGRWFTAHARELRKVDARLEALALRFSAIRERPMLPANKASPAGWSAPAWLRGPAGALGSTIERAASDVASRALPNAVREGAVRLSARAGHEVGAWSGAHDRLRAGGRQELTRMWVGPGEAEVDPRPYLTQLLDLVDRTAAQAKDIIG